MPFEKGNKAAVGHGRPKIAEEFRATCRKAVDDHVIHRWRMEVETGGEHWVKCSELLAAYGYGKPAQPIEHSGADGEPLSIAVRLVKPDGA